LRPRNAGDRSRRLEHLEQGVDVGAARVLERLRFFAEAVEHAEQRVESEAIRLAGDADRQAGELDRQALRPGGLALGLVCSLTALAMPSRGSSPD
jgi:hypothetical protein